MRITSYALIAVVSIVFAACGAEVAPDASGAEIYEQVCARCHGSDLSGGLGPALGAGTAAAEQTDEAYVQTITRGRGRMPAFGSSLTDAQIELVIDFLREEQAR